MEFPTYKHVLNGGLRDSCDVGLISGDHALSGYIKADILRHDGQFKPRFRRDRSGTGFSAHIDKEEKLPDELVLARLCEIDVHSRITEYAKVFPTITKVGMHEQDVAFAHHHVPKISARGNICPDQIPMRQRYAAAYA